MALVVELVGHVIVLVVRKFTIVVALALLEAKLLTRNFTEAVAPA